MGYSVSWNLATAGAPLSAILRHPPNLLDGPLPFCFAGSDWLLGNPVGDPGVALAGSPERPNARVVNGRAEAFRRLNIDWHALCGRLQ